MTSTLITKTTEEFAGCKSKVGEGLFLEISSQIEAQRGELQFLLKWLYANSPAADWGRYDFSLFLKFAEHGLYLREHSPFAKDLPERVFLSYVLHPRVNDEALSDCRELFFSLLEERLEGLSLENAALAVNEFCAEHVSYHGSDERTRSALSAYLSATGRCGEESVFAVNALRAVGIPARQVYAPLWSHCDDNHAWVEVLFSDGWHFMGACEPEEIVDCGWFNNAAPRAMFAYARCFGTPPEGDVLFSEPPLSYLNVLPRYAAVKKFTVSVREGEKPVENANVRFEILNYGRFLPVANCKTDERGEVSLFCGIGSLHLCVSKGDRSQRLLIDTAERNVVDVDLSAKEQDAEGKFLFLAPEGGSCGKIPTAEQRKIANEKKLRAEQLRREKVLPDVRRQFENEGELQELLSVISQKDLQDIHPEVLREALKMGREYQNNFPREIYFSALLNPRVENEPLLPDRKKIYEFFPETEREAFRKDPQKVLKRAFEGEISPATLTRTFPSPLAILRGQAADVRSRNILCVQIFRAIGVPSRLMGDRVQIFRDGDFVDLFERPNATLLLESDGEAFTLSEIFPEGEREVFPISEIREKDKITLTLPAGEYRLLTQNRLPSGNIRAVSRRFPLSEGEKKRLKLEGYPATLADYTVDIPLGELSKEDGVYVLLSPGEEPTEHFFAESEEVSLDLKPIILLQKGREPSAAIKNRFQIGTFEEEWAERMARRTYVEPGKFPLVFIIKGGRARFVSAGYRVGCVSLVQKIGKLLFQEDLEKNRGENT